MGKDIKKRFTVSLDIETKDVEKQVKATVGNLKTILADLGKASDKMSYFKELVDYIGQIDTALTALKNKNKDAFNHMFDGLDADLKKVMESIFDTSGKSMSVLDNLRNRLNDASKNGAGVKELRQIAAEINTLFTSLGRAEPIDIDAQFSGRGKTEDRIKLLTDALDNFATVWDGVHNKVKNGFGFEGTGGVVEFSEKVQKEIDVLEDKIKSIQDLMTELQNVFKMTKAFNDGKDVSLGFEATEESAKNLLEQFKLLSSTRQKFLEDGDTSSPAYYENLIQYTKAATQLVALNDELAKSSKGSPKFLANALSGEFVDVYDFIESFDKRFVSSIQTSLGRIIADAQTGIDKIKADALKNVPKNAGKGTGAFDGGGNTADDEMTKNKALAGSYEELSNKINEYYDILQRRKKFDEDSEEFTDLSFKLDGIADYIEKIKSLSLEEKLELNDIFGDLTYEEYGPEEALKRICNILQVEIPSAAKTAKKSLDGLGESADGSTGSSSGGSGGTITNVDFTSLENTIKAEIASIANKLDSVFKVEVVKNDTEDIKNAIDGVKSTIEKISAEIDNYNTLKKTDAHQAEVNAMKNNLTQLFKFVSEFNNKQLNGQYQDQEISAAILSDGSITTGYGEDGTVPWDRMASALVSNLTKSLMVDIHSHPWAQNGYLDRYANDSFSGSKGDLGAFRFSKELGAQMAAMITGNVMRTLDISKLTDEQMKQFRKALAQIEKTKANAPEYSKYMEYKNDKLYYHSQPTLDEQHKVTEAFESLMYEAFKQIGLSKDKVDKEIFKKYDLTDDAQLTKLAEHLVHLSQSSQNALSPVERLSEIISHFSGDVNSKTAKENFEAFTKGELTAAEVFNNLNRDGHILNQETLDSLYKIDSANEIPAIESLLTQVISVLNTIDSSVSSINNNTRQSTSERFDTAINDILDIREDVDNKHILSGIKSIFDPLNVSEYKNKEVLQIADSAVLDAKDYIADLYANSNYSDSVNVDEMLVALDKFYLAIANVQDAIKQVELYESRTGKIAIDANGDMARAALGDKYAELTDEGLLNNLLRLLSQAKIDIQESKYIAQDGFTGLPEDNSDRIFGGLQSIQSILDSIYGVLHGFTGIEADNKNSFKYKEPSVDTSASRKEFSDQDLSVLNSILQVLQGIDSYLSANKSDDVTDKVAQDDTDISDLGSFIKSKLSQQLATEDTLQAVKGIVDNLASQLSNDNVNPTQDDKITEDQQSSDVYQLLSSKLPQNVASEDTLQAIKGAIEQIAELLRAKDETTKDDDTGIVQSLNTLISALTTNVATLKDVANGIVQHQKAQKSDTSVAMARLQDSKEQQIISGIAKGSVIDLGTEVEIESLQALANGLVKVEGAFKNANGQWEGFTVKVNEANQAVDLAIKKQSAFARALNKAKDIDENTYQYNKEEVEARAKKHLEEYAAQGKNATVQFKDSGRYTITILEEIDGLSKQIFQTFDENDDKIERTTVTMSNSQKLKLENLQKKLIDNGLTNGLISDSDKEYKDYQSAVDALSNMTNAYSKMDNISDVEIANWKQQIALVQHLGNQVSDLVKKRKLANDQKVFESDRSKKLSKFDLDKSTLQKDIAIPDSFNKLIGDARADIENAIDADSLKIAINNWEALQNKIKQTAVEQDLYIKKTKEVKNTNTKPDQFTKDITKQKADFAKYKADAQNALGVTDELRDKLVKLENDLNAIGDGDTVGLNNWIQSLKSLKTEISNTQKSFKASQIAVSSDIAGKANSKFKELNFKAADNNLTQEQEEIVNKRKELIQQIKEYNIKVNSGQKAEIDGINATRDALYQLIDAYKKKYNITNGNGNTKKGQAYGLNQLQTFTARYNSLISGASEVGLNEQSTAVANLVNAYKQLQMAQSAFVAGEDKTTAEYAKKVEVFKAAQLACNNYARELNQAVSSSKKLAADSVASDALAEDFIDTFDGRKAALTDFVNTMYGTNASIDKFDNSFNELNFTVKNGDGTFTKMTATINEARTAIHATAGATGEVTSKFKSFVNELSGKFKSIGAYFVASFGWQEIWQQVRQGIEYVREIDGALTELKKVTNETDATYDRFLQSMSKTGSVIGATVQDLTTMAADWARLGYSMEEAGKLAESTAILLNVSEFENATDASEALISTMQAFQYTADDSQHVVDILNEIGNNYAVSSDGLAIALQDSASALMEAGNNLEQSVALVAAANKVVQDPNSVGSALRTISLRLRGTSVEILEEMGEETDGAVESISKMQEKLKALTGVDILTDSGAYKDTYTILKDIAEVWDDMSSMDQAAALELMAGKNRANTLAAILNNIEDLKGAYESALSAEGSAMRENEAYLDSIQGRIDLFNNALQTFWMNLLDTSVIKGVVDAGTALIKFADTFTGKLVIIKAALLVFKKFQDKVTFKEMFKGAVDNAQSAYSAIKKMVTATNSVTKADVARALASKGLTGSLKEQIIAEAGLKGVKTALTKEQIKATAATLSAKFATGELTTAQYLAAMSTMGLKTAFEALGRVLLKNPMYLIAAVVAAAALAFDHFNTTAQEAADTAKEAFDEIRSVVESTESAIQSLESELSTLQDKIDELDGKKLSFAEDQELEKLKNQRKELEHSLKVQEQLLELQRESSNKQAVASMKAYTKAASEGAGETQEAAKIWGTIGGVVAGIAAAVGIIAAIPSGGLSLGATAAGVGALGAAGGVAGNKIGEAVGSGVAANEGTYDSWYETYTKALDAARKDEQKALEKYQKDSSNIDKLDKWQEAQQRTSDIETEMYEHLSQMQQYMNSLDYGVSDEIDAELDTWNNFLDKFSIDQGASGAEVTALDRIFGENASEEIQSIKEQILDAVNAGEDFDFDSAINGSQQLKNTLDYVGLSAEDVKNYFTQIGEAATTVSSNSEKINPVDTYSAIIESVSKYNDILAQTTEILGDNTQVTQEYKDSIVKLIGSEEDINDCFDDNNKLVVKNAKKLKDLVSQNIKLKKAQSQLDYYNLVKQLNATLNGTKDLDSATKDSIYTLLDQIDTVELAIYQYQQLENSLLGATNAFDEFAKAQEVDALNTYGDSYTEMVQTMYDAMYKTGQVGTKAFETATEFLVPDSVYQGMKEEADRMKAIYDYFNGNILPTGNLKEDQFSLDYDSLEYFVKDALDSGVFAGDIENFDLVEGMNLEKAAELMGRTETQAYALFAELDKYNTNGTELSFLSQLDDSLEGRITKTTNKMEELNRQKLALLEDGGYEKNKEAIDGLNQQLAQCDKNLEAASVEAYNMWQAYSNNDVALNALSAIENKQEQITKEGATTLGLEWDEVKGKTIQQVYDEILAKQQELGIPTELTVQFAKEHIDAELDELEKKLEKKEIDIEANVVFDKKDNQYEVTEGSQYANDEDLQRYINLQNEGYALDNYFESGMTVTEEYLSSIKDILQSIYDYQTGNTTEDTTTSVSDSTNAQGFDFDNVKQFADNVGTFFTETIPEIAGDISEELNKFFTETVPEKWNEFWESVGGYFEEIAAEAEGLYKIVNNFFTETIPEKWNEFWDAAEECITEDVPYAIGYAAGAVTKFLTVTLPEAFEELWNDIATFFTETIPNAAQDVQTAIVTFFTSTLPKKWAEFWDSVSKFVSENIAPALESIYSKLSTFFTTTVPEKWDEFWTSVTTFFTETIPGALAQIGERLTEFFTITLPEKWSGFWSDIGTFLTTTIPTAVETISEGITTFFTQTVPGAINGMWGSLTSWISEKASEVWSNLTAGFKAGLGGGGGVNGTAHASGTARKSGTANANGTPHKSGSWGAPKTETSLVGELGPEILVRGNRWTTVGDNGAEFTQVKKGDIIFNHKQTESLLKNGYVTGRGKAYASGTAYAGLWNPTSPNTSQSNKPGNDFTEAGNRLFDAADSISGAAGSLSDAASDAADEFRETFDWIEVRLEEINEDLDLKNAKLENAVGHKKQNTIIDDMIDLNEKLYDNLLAGANKYYAYAEKLLAKVPSAYREAAQDGTIAIETFVGEVDEKTLEAIQDYREWVQKGADATQQAEETLSEISALAKEAFDNIVADYDNKTSLRDSKIDQLDAYNALSETDLGSESAAIYEAMIKENNKNINTLGAQRNAMQAELDKRVASGEIKVGSQDWYDAVNEISAVDTKIIELTTDTENYQDAINDLHWDHFDNLIERMESVSDEADSLVDILSNKDLVDEDGNWTDEGITSLGLYAQKMEAAEVQAQKYKEEIDYLNKNWERLGYTEQEYIEKLDELKDGQYDAIQAYNDSKEAIKDLTAERVDAIKEGIEKEIEAYEELINKKKEELSAEKDLYDFQNGVAEQQKEISDIERKIAALSADNSASARAKRAQLEAELLKAQAALEETYYERSIEDQQNALDKELESFQKEKEQEIEGWDTYLENTNQVVADGLATVQANTEVVYHTLQAMGQEYSLDMTEALTSPWREGESAIQSFSEKFGISMSATVDELNELSEEYETVMKKIENSGNKAVDQVNDNANKYTQGKQQNIDDDDGSKEEHKQIKVGGKINAGNAKIYDYAGDKSGQKQYYADDPIYKVLKIDGDWIQVRHHKQSTGTTGWFRKGHVQAYAKGTKGVNEDQLALIDELGDELIMHAGKDGKLAFLSKGSAVIPHDISENLMQLGELNPQDILDRNRPVVSAPHVTNNNIELNVTFGEVVHIDHVDNNAVPNLAKVVDKQIDKYMKGLNAEIRKFTR